MNVETALTKISYALRGIDDEAPTFGDDESNYWVSVLNDKKDELFKNPNLSWSSAFKAVAPTEPGTVATSGTTTLIGSGTYFTDYRVGDKITVSGETERTIDTISSNTSLTVTTPFSTTASDLTLTHKSIIAAGVQFYNLHRSLNNPSDQVVILTTDGVYRYIDYIQAGARNDVTRGAYISGENPKVLTINTTIQSTEDIVGGELQVPGFYVPNDISAATDLLPFPDANWGVMATASEVAFNDVIYEDKAADLNRKANALYQAMAATNRKGEYARPRTIPYNMRNRILDPRSVD
jgi:hypothetical protein